VAGDSRGETSGAARENYDGRAGEEAGCEPPTHFPIGRREKHRQHENTQQRPAGGGRH